MAQSRSRSRTPPHSYRRRNSADCHQRRRSSRKHGRSSARRHYRSISSPRSIGSTSGCSSCPSTPKPFGRPVDPPANKCLGVFGLSSYTKESHLMDVFAKYGIIEKAVIVYDAKTKISRGFGFVYYQELKAASAAKVECNGMVLHERTIRVDYSVTERPHTPTPGVYLGDRDTGKRRCRSSYSYRGRSYE
ncbi:transformer-2 protein homolog beta-like isoform X2 [Ochlerotatus camptorhynchus]|uniref:transformer-2 protein homolog beta-like isoform X2 n=1 Tax=Ochlerotatus camptorhynchus TaxID=644619 RepID=UPI0031D6FC4C